MVFHKSDILTPNLLKVLLGNNENINLPQSCLFGGCNEISFLVNCLTHRWPCIIKQWVNHLHPRMSYSYLSTLLTDHCFWKLSFQSSRCYSWTTGLILSLFVHAHTFCIFHVEPKYGNHFLSSWKFGKKLAKTYSTVYTWHLTVRARNFYITIPLGHNSLSNIQPKHDFVWFR